MKIEKKSAEKTERIEKTELKSGLEIHQQLDTGKLFCSCPGILRQDAPDFVVKRKLHAVAGETGEIDKAAAFEAAKEREFVYEAYNDTTCLVELDEEPCHAINQEALKVALQISLLLNCEIIPVTQIMRKTVIDGSNTSGFQRTLLIARNGYIETSEGRVGIQSIALEEDAARIIRQEGNAVVYRLDRLGIPLIEIATFPDIKTPQQAKEAALHLGEILRACKVKRGIGTIRQDVNLSIKGGERVEIKGVQEPALIEKTIINEAERQKILVKDGKSRPEVRKALPDGNTEFLRPLPGAARMYPETDLPLLRISREFINYAKKELPRLKHEIKDELRAGGLSDEMIKLILEENRLEDFKSLVAVYNAPNLVAKMLVLWKKEIASHEKLKESEVEEKLNPDIIESILQLVKSKSISESDAKRIMLGIAKGKSIEEALKEEKPSNTEEEILSIIKEKPGLSINAYMGLVMERFKGKISGSEAISILKKLLTG
ncbi:Glu-tRNA(Gln) amidotransferase subunit GatE [Candidatus Pacearchaeota archaeon]|nr:Glu-tRNA(Gln) amidotransferase subunit GatE [Candidatus Pacearchaeota archaeon]